MDDNYERDYGLVVLELLQTLKEKVALILAATILAAALGWGFSAFLMPRKYEASVNMIVNTRTEIVGVVTSDSISSAQDLVDTYAIIIKSNKVLNQVIEKLDLKMTYEELSKQITVDPIRSTQVMKIAAHCPSADQAALIVQTISEIAPDIVADAVEAGSCKVVSDVYSSSKPISPNILKTTAMAAVLTFLTVCALVVLQELFHDYIVDDADLERKLGITALGVIPDVEA
ncbi:MAG: capsular biosynthesis protein [Oscillospiraceae bacterium]|nr:capsular biosynthesis protein [Oscillospiraceae bacterium]